MLCTCLLEQDGTGQIVDHAGLVMNQLNRWGRARRAGLGWLVMNCLAFSVMLIVTQPGATAQTTEKPSKGGSPVSGNAENGKRLFNANDCWECHGYQGQGGVGPRIGPPPILLSVVIAYLRHPKGEMPPYTTKVLSDSDITDIYSFLQSVPKPPPAKSIPLLNY